jgi:hypothetical protein
VDNHLRKNFASLTQHRSAGQAMNTTIAPVWTVGRNAAATTLNSKKQTHYFATLAVRLKNETANLY